MVSVSLCMIVKMRWTCWNAVWRAPLSWWTRSSLWIPVLPTAPGRSPPGLQIKDFPWRDDFSAARNESFSHASMDYCIWLDADDILL